MERKGEWRSGPLFLYLPHLVMSLSFSLVLAVYVHVFHFIPIDGLEPTQDASFLVPMHFPLHASTDFVVCH